SGSNAPRACFSLHKTTLQLKITFIHSCPTPRLAPRRRLPPSKKNFRRQAGSERFAKILRRFARNARLARRRERTGFQRSARVSDCAKRSRAAAVFVFVG